MPPSVFQVGMVILAAIEVPARLVTKKGGYKRIGLPLGTYEITEIVGNEVLHPSGDYSARYTYRLQALETASPLSGHRISIWQDDLETACLG